jgi:hypothetical protein
MVVALLALFVAMGGVGYAAFKLPNNSVGSKQIKKGAVNSSKVKDASLLAGDFKAGQLPAGARGIQGLKGDPCPASDANCKGPKGDTGPQGPGALSFDGQILADGANPTIYSINGMTLAINCNPAGGVDVSVYNNDDAHRNFYGWGTKIEDGTLSEATPIPPGGPTSIRATGTSRAQLAIVASSTATGETVVKWTRFDVLGIRGSFCNYHALIIPPSS